MARELSADKTRITVTPDAGRVTLNVAANVPWRITQASPVSWISSILPETGSDNQQITIVYDENTVSTNREAILTLAATGAGATETVRITLTQSAAGARVLSAAPSSLTPTADAGSITFDVSANVPWAITNSDTWITSIMPKAGSDNQRITITYEENTAITLRDAVLTLATTDGGSESETITLTQAEAARQLLADKTDISVNANETSATFNVTANVPWAITKRAEDDWITTISLETGSDNQEITITYEENTAITTRDAVLTLATTDGGSESETITLTQAEAARQLSADDTNISINIDDTSVTFNVIANVPWKITKRDTDDWITSISPETGSGNEEITIVYDNTLPTNRDAVLTLAATDGGTESTDITITQVVTAVVGLPTVARNLRFYPNPASQTLYIEGITQETSLIIRTLAGKTLLRATLRQNEAVDITALPQGTYILTLQNAQEQVTSRLVIGF